MSNIVDLQEFRQARMDKYVEEEFSILDYNVERAVKNLANYEDSDDHIETEMLLTDLAEIVADLSEHDLELTIDMLKHYTQILEEGE